jgi:hypothetical protein
MLEIRKSTYDDLVRIAEIFAYARKQMALNGNPSQWKNDRPSMELVKKDIDVSNSYVVLNEGKIVATFAFIVGVEPTYLDIDGKWLDDGPYGTIHRIASDGSVKGVFDQVIDYVGKRGVDIRIDTHKDNKIMRHLIEKNGFVYCGIIIVDDGTPRLAYQKKIR